jgi:glycosyltransferase involved in cell wall biosynthesis
MLDRAVVSVIVPTRNSVRTIAACLSSVRSQTYPNLELIVIDKSSTDGTIEVAREYADVVQSGGPERSAQRNLGARIAKGSYLFFVDSDMILQPAVVFDSLNAMKASGAPAVIIPEESIGEGFWAKCRILERSCYEGDDLVEAARFFRREIFESHGGFDERLTGPEDWDLSLRVAAGSPLPRAHSQVFHDEGRIRLGSALAKKFYYARSFRVYIHKHGTLALRQANIIVRPAFLRRWRRLLGHPLLSAGIFVLKGLELGAAVAGAASGTPRSLAPPSGSLEKLS